MIVAKNADLDIVMMLPQLALWHLRRINGSERMGS
jgi:hypothetical protein